MIIKLERTLAPEDMGKAHCAIYGDTFELGTVAAWASTGEEGRYGIGDADSWVCPTCIEVRGKYRPDRFPAIENTAN